jgi:hypothetical protein
MGLLHHPMDRPEHHRLETQNPAQPSGVLFLTATALATAVSNPWKISVRFFQCLEKSASTGSAGSTLGNHFV